MSSNPHNPSASPAIVVVGASLGGLNALHTLLGGLRANFPVPLAIVQHRRAGAQERLVGLLQKKSALLVTEAEDKQPIEPGNVYLAPADYHLLVDNGHLSLSIDKPVCHARPSIDVLFQSAADAFGAGVIGIILSGTGVDGAEGVAAIKSRGGAIVAENPQTSAASQMPEAAISTGAVDYNLQLKEIAVRLAEIISS